MPTPQPLTAISAASDGTVYGLNNGTVLQALPSPPWTEVGGQLLTSISAAWDGTVWGLTSQQSAFTYTNGAWVAISSTTPHLLRQVSVGNAENIWGLDITGNTYQYSSAGSWAPIQTSPLVLSSICATPDGSVWGLDGGGLVYQYLSASGWQPIAQGPPEGLISLGAATAEWAWGIGQSGAVYQYDGIGMAWISPAVQSGSVTPNLTAIYCGSDTTVMAQDSSGNAYQLDLDTQNWNVGGVVVEADGFAALPNAALGSLAVGNAQNIWALDTGGNVWQFTGGNWNWTPVTVNGVVLNQIAVGSATDIWGLDGPGNVYQVAVASGVWTPNQLVGAPQMSSLSVGSDGCVVGVRTASPITLMQYVGSGQWSPMAALPLTPKYVSVGNATNIWALDSQYNAYQFVPGSNQWQSIASPAYPTALSLSLICAAPDGSAWAIASGQQLCMYFGSGNGWYVTATSLAQVAAASLSTLWGIDPDGNAVYMNFGADQTGLSGTAFREGSIRPRGHAVEWDAQSKTDEAKSTHLWIVNRAMNVANLGGDVGTKIYQLYTTNEVFSFALCQGLWAADFLAPYNNAVFGTVKTYSSHFYDPATGTNYLGQTSPTGLTQCQLYFWNSLAAYLNGDFVWAGFYLGLALHYLTDATQPMHAANYTYFSSSSMGYHTDFEKYVMECQGGVLAPTSYTPWPSGTEPFDINPAQYYLTAAQNSKSRYFSTIVPPNMISYDGVTITQDGPNPDIVWRPMVAPLIPAMLTDAINITSQFLVGWMTLAASEMKNCTLVNLASGLAADVHGAQTGAGVNLWLFPWNNTSAQRFMVIPNSSTPPSCKLVTACSGNGKVVDVQNGSNAAGAQIVQNPSSSATSQLWQFAVSPSGNSSQVIQNQYSQLYITPSSGGTTQKTNLVQDGPTTNQGWLVAPAAPVFMQAVGLNLVADITNASPNPGTPLQVWTLNKGTNQQFLWVPLSGEDDGYYMILVAVSGLCLCMVAEPAQPPWYVQQLAWSPTNDNAKWSMVSAEDGNFYIQNKQGLVYDGSLYSYLYVPTNALKGNKVGYTVEPQTATAWILQPAQFMSSLSTEEEPTDATVPTALSRAAHGQ